MNEEKGVYLDQYCKSCKHHGLEESKDPCNDCLAEPSNTNSHKPMNYESKNNALLLREVLLVYFVVSITPALICRGLRNRWLWLIN